MKSELDLLHQYQDEKALVIGSYEERTGLEDFQSYKEWKLQYMKEYAETHDMDNPLSMEEAVDALETEINNDLNFNPENLDEEFKMANTETNTATATPAKTTAAKPGKATRVRKASKATAKPAAKAAPKAPSKASVAQKIFDRLYPKVLEGKKARKDVIAEFVAKADLTEKGAATYYQKFRTAASA